METSSEMILKKNKVRLAAGEPPPSGPSSHDPTGQAEVRLVEQDEGGAVIEVTCRCGNKILLRCEYSRQGSQEESGADAPPSGAAEPAAADG